MFAYKLLPTTDKPFPHVTADSFLEPEAYRALSTSFPLCPPNSGPTGYSYFWGDPAFDALLEAHPVWKRLFERTQCQAFVDHALAQFSSIIAREACVDLAAARYVPQIESREYKEKRHLPATGLPADALFVRTDILQGNVGYERAPHLDHRRRAVTMLIYFCDGDDAGGDLVLHGPDGATKIVRPRHNRMVMFPCSNSSLHSVSRIVTQARPRNFVQLSVSSTVDLWPQRPEGSRLGRVLRQGMKRLLPTG